MPTITFTLSDGLTRTVTGSPGRSVMETAVQNGIPGIVAECGGACACATCHVYIDESFIHAVGEPGDWEEEMLEDVVSPRRAGSRLSCQIALTSELDGLAVTIPEEQQ